MTPAILRAAMDARYILMVRAQYCDEAREKMFDAIIAKLTAALQEHSDTLPSRPTLREINRHYATNSESYNYANGREGREPL